MDFFGTALQPIVVIFLLGELTLLGVFLLAFVLARLHKGRPHHYVMLGAFLTDVLVFKPLMFSRALSVWGPFPWQGTRIALHFFLSIATALFGVFAIYLGFKHRTRKGAKMFMPPKGRVHKRVGFLFLILWGTTIVVGLVIFKQNYYP